VVCSLPWEEAWLMAGRLRTVGIDAAVSPDYYVPLPVGTRGSFDVLVPSDRMEDARRVARAFLRGMARPP
jgi:hypothetical protein